SRAAPRRGPVPRGEPAEGVDRGRGRRDRRCGLCRRRSRRLHDVPPGPQGDRRAGGCVRGPAGRAGDLGRQRPVRPDGRRARRLSRTTSGQGWADVPDPVGDRVDDARVDPARRRPRRARGRRREPVPPALDLRAHGSVDCEDAVAISFPRSWIYDHEGALAGKSGTVDFKTWYRESHGDNTPWGDEESEALVTAAETARERELSQTLLSADTKFHRRDLGEGAVLVTQGATGDE